MIHDLEPYPAYKDSGVPWMGQIPAHWDLRRTKTLLRERSEKGFPGEPLLAATQTKGVVRKEQYENRTVVALKDLHLLKLVRVGDFVISLRSFQGGIEFAREQGIISPAYTILYPIRSEMHGYLAKLFKSKPYTDNLSLFVTGIRQGQNIDYEGLSRAVVPCPPLAEQVSIARFLDHTSRRIQRCIRAKKKLIALLNEQKQAIIHRAVTRGLDPGVRLKTSEVEWLGEVPEHWEVGRLKRVCKVQGGYAFSSSDFGDSGVPVVRMNNLRRGELNLNNAVRIPESKCLTAFALRAGDVLYGLSGSIGSTGSLGNHAVVGEGDLPAQLNQRVARFTFESASLLPAFFVLVIQTPLFYEQVLASTTGTAQFNVSTNDIADIVLGLPPTTEQERIEAEVALRTKLIAGAMDSGSKEIDLLREYRSRLIADVVIGKLDVREAAARLPEEIEDLEPLDEAEALAEGDEVGEEAEGDDSEEAVA